MADETEVQSGSFRVEGSVKFEFAVELGGEDIEKVTAWLNAFRQDPLEFMNNGNGPLVSGSSIALRRVQRVTRKVVKSYEDVEIPKAGGDSL